MRACHDTDRPHANRQDIREQQIVSERSALSVVVPAYDEEKGLLATLAGLREVLSRSGWQYEIVVVNDGSRDATPHILSACTDVTVVHHRENRGYGAALKTGIATARHPLVLVIDADGTYAAAAVPALIDRCATADMVVGARIGPHVHSTPARGAAKWCFRQFAQWITGTPIPDLNSGLRVFDSAVAARFADLLPDGFSFTTTITVAAILERLVVQFEPVDYLPRIGRSKIRPVRDTLRIARHLLWLGLRLAPFRTAVVIALPLFVASLGSSFSHLVRLGRITLADMALLVAGSLVLGSGIRAELGVRRRRCVRALPPLKKGDRGGFSEACSNPP
jgi:glycosyltransferase involved in cell wall biosynthesis